MDLALFQTLTAFLKESSGLSLTSDKIYLVNSRLQPVADSHGCRSIPELVRKLSLGAGADLKRDIIEAMTTNETSFFRDSTPFENFKKHVLPLLIERRASRKSLRILCAAASTGQEPYSLAITLAEHAAKLMGWRLEITGIDIDTKVLGRAEAATYTQFEVQRGLPVQLLMKYFVQADNQTWQLKPEIRKMVTFRQRNLLSPLIDLGNFDVIFCRNVLIYFEPPMMKAVLERLADRLSEDGYLFLGGAETVLNITERFAPIREWRGVYGPRLAATTARTATA